MTSGRFRFASFLLDGAARRLTQDGAAVDLNSRYLDALILLVREHGGLVTKDRFMDEVWRGVPVTDEALTQCIKTLRKALGDNAADPRFIETVPKHGYRFIAAVEADAESASPAPRMAPAAPWRAMALLGGAGTAGACAAGTLGGLFYGLAAQPAQPGMGAVSVLLVLMALTVLVALLGGAGVAFGIAMARPASRHPAWSVLGGAVGGFIIGALGKLIGLDAFRFLLGRAPGDITGAAEGIALGGAVGLGFWLASRGGSIRRGLCIAGAAGAATGLAVSLLGGRLMGGSLDLLSRSFPDSQLRMDRIGALLGENGFGPIAQAVTASLEGGLFAIGIVGAMLLARQSLRPR